MTFLSIIAQSDVPTGWPVAGYVAAGGIAVFVLAIAMINRRLARQAPPRAHARMDSPRP